MNGYDTRVRGKVYKMSDMILAKNLVTEIAGNTWDSKGEMLKRVHRACQRHGANFTPRRIRSFWHMEAAGVLFTEMIELMMVARAEKSRQDEIKTKRMEHAEFIGRANGLLEQLAVDGQGFSGQYREALRALSGRSEDGKNHQDEGRHCAVNDCVGQHGEPGRSDRHG